MLSVYLLHSTETFKNLLGLRMVYSIKTLCQRHQCPLFHLFFFCLQLATGGQNHVPMADRQEDSEETDVSLITGALRGHNLLISEPSESTCGSSVVLRNQTMTVANTANSAGTLTRRVGLPPSYPPPIPAIISNHAHTVLHCFSTHPHVYSMILKTYSNYVTVYMSLENKMHCLALHYKNVSLFSIFSGRKKLAWFGAEVGRNSSGEGREGQERHRNSIRRRRSILVIIYRSKQSFHHVRQATVTVLVAFAGNVIVTSIMSLVHSLLHHRM